MEKGLIVSIQKYSLSTTQELAEKAIYAGAIAIRTDQPINIEKPIIGLRKNDKEYYITTDREDIIYCNKWADYIAIDSRKGNQDLELLYAHCHISNIMIIADIENIQDVINLLDICKSKKIKLPEYISTTFDFDKTIDEKINIINEIKEMTNIPIIAEGGYSIKEDVEKAYYAGVKNVCIGTAICDIIKLTKGFI